MIRDLETIRAGWPEEIYFAVQRDEGVEYDPLYQLPSWEWMAATAMICFGYRKRKGMLVMNVVEGEAVRSTKVNEWTA